jgi:hypothetical protein
VCVVCVCVFAWCVRDFVRLVWRVCGVLRFVVRVRVVCACGARASVWCFVVCACGAFVRVVCV